MMKQEPMNKIQKLTDSHLYKINIKNISGLNTTCVAKALLDCHINCETVIMDFKYKRREQTRI